MLIILPNDMSRCWQERAERKDGRKKTEVQHESKYLSGLILETCICSDIKTANYLTCSRFKQYFWTKNLHRFISSLDYISDLIIVVLCFSARQGAVTVSQEMV